MVYSAKSDDIGTISQFTRLKYIHITTTGSSTPANYQVKLTIDYEPEMQADFSDIRFNTLGNIYIDYWIESKTDSVAATVWVELPDAITDPGSNTIWMYYGNHGLSDGGVGADVFNIFDDAERGSNGDPVGGDWTIVQGNADISTEQAYGGTRSIKLLVGSSAAYIRQIFASSDDYSIQFRLRREETATFVLIYGDGDHAIDLYIDSNENINYYDGSVNDTGYNSVVDTWELYEIKNIDFTSNTFDMYHNGGLIKSGATMLASASYDGIIQLQGQDGTGADKDSYVDNFIVRKYIANEPTPSYGTSQHQRRVPQFIS